MNCMPIESNSLDFRINQLIENVFKFTLNKNPDSATKVQPLVYLEELAAASDSSCIGVDLLEHALFERLLLDDPSSHVVNGNKNLDLRVTLNECITYLFECFKDMIMYRNGVKGESEEWIRTIDNIIKLIIRNAATALKQPDLYSSQNIHAQVSILNSAPRSVELWPTHVVSFE